MSWEHLTGGFQRKTFPEIRFRRLLRKWVREKCFSAVCSKEYWKGRSENLSDIWAKCLFWGRWKLKARARIYHSNCSWGAEKKFPSIASLLISHPYIHHFISAEMPSLERWKVERQRHEERWVMTGSVQPWHATFSTSHREETAKEKKAKRLSGREEEIICKNRFNFKFIFSFYSTSSLPAFTLHHMCVSYWFWYYRYHSSGDDVFPPPPSPSSLVAKCVKPRKLLPVGEETSLSGDDVRRAHIFIFDCSVGKYRSEKSD